MALQTISGDITNALGVNATGLEFTIESVVKLKASASGAIVGVIVPVRVASNGSATVALEPGAYTISARIAGANVSAPMLVGDGGPYDWNEVIDVTEGVDINAALGAALAAASAAANSATAAAIAADLLTGIEEQIHLASLPVPAGWWDTGERLLSGTSARAIISNWDINTVTPASMWLPTVAASVFDANTGGAAADPGDGIGRIEDQVDDDYHLTQASASLRPVFGRRPASGVRNLLTTPSNVATAFFNATVQANNAVSPTGDTDADTVTATTAGSVFYAVRSFAFVAGNAYTFSLHIKPLNTRYFRMTSNNASIFSGAGVFDLEAGTVVSGDGATITALENGWYRCSVTGSSTTSGTQPIYAIAAASGAGANLLAPTNGYQSHAEWGAQLEIGSTVTAYQAVVNALDVTEDSVPSVSYAAFDLVDDALATAPIAGGFAGQVFVAGDGGCYVSDLTIAPGGTFSLGGISGNWTGAAPNILRAVTGDTGRFMGASVRASAFTADQITRLERRFRGWGGKGLLVPTGAELVGNGTFFANLTGWSQPNPERGNVTWEAGTAKIDNASAANNTLTRGVSGMVVGGWYLLTATVTASAGTTPRIGIGASGVGSASLVGSTGVIRFVHKATGTTANVNLIAQGGVGAGVFANFDNVSLQRLLPREEI